MAQIMSKYVNVPHNATIPLYRVQLFIS